MFQEYLKKNIAKGIIDFAIRANHNPETGEVTFYIHPANVSGITEDYIVDGNNLTNRFVCIVVNGVESKIEPRILSYNDICELAHQNAAHNPSIIVKTPSGAGYTMSHNDMLSITPGEGRIIIDCIVTGAA